MESHQLSLKNIKYKKFNKSVQSTDKKSLKEPRILLDRIECQIVNDLPKISGKIKRNQWLV